MERSLIVVQTVDRNPFKTVDRNPFKTVDKNPLKTVDRNPFKTSVGVIGEEASSPGLVSSVRAGVREVRRRLLRRRRQHSCHAPLLLESLG